MTTNGRSKVLSVAAAALATGLALGNLTPAAAADAAVAVPPPAEAVRAPADATTEVAVLAGGCFWGVQGVFQHVKGVTGAVSGYAGGEKRTARYEDVGSGRTGHAEAVRVSFDPHQMSYGQILQIYFSVAHDPTELNRQGPDSGPQYRSTIFAQSPEQARVAKAYIAQLGAAKSYERPIVTTVESEKPFFDAEAYHQNYLTLHPNAPYIVWNDLPKLENLKKVFPERYRAAPVLVNVGT